MTSEFTTAQSRSLIVLGLVVHVDGVSIFVVNNRQHIAYNALSSTYDLAEAMGIFNINGNVFSGNAGGNLSIDKTVGNVFRMGSNYETANDNPHEKTLTLITAGTFTYVYNNNATGVTGTLIDPTSLDDGAGGLTTLSNNTKWSVQRIYSFTSNVVAIQRGVTEYNSQDEAVNGIDGSAYFQASSLEANGLLRGWLVVKKNATDLTDISEAQFIEAPKFGSGGGSSGGSVSIVDLQTAYNNSTTPEVLTDATRGGLTIKRGSASDTDNVLEIQNGAGGTTVAIDGNGGATFGGDIEASNATLNGNLDIISDSTFTSLKISTALALTRQEYYLSGVIRAELLIDSSKIQYSHTNNPNAEHLWNISGVTRLTLSPDILKSFGRIIQNVTDGGGQWGIQGESLRVEGVGEFGGDISTAKAYGYSNFSVSQNITMGETAAGSVNSNNIHSFSIRTKGNGANSAEFNLVANKRDGTTQSSIEEVFLKYNSSTAQMLGDLVVSGNITATIPTGTQVGLVGYDSAGKLIQGSLGGNGFLSLAGITISANGNTSSSITKSGVVDGQTVSVSMNAAMYSGLALSEKNHIHSVASVDNGFINITTFSTLGSGYTFPTGAGWTYKVH
jgi:hypothetical protein